jgi:hypothetical protein
MRFILIQLAIVTLSSTISLAGPASKAFSLKLQFGPGAESSDNRVVMDAFEIRRTLEQIQKPGSADVRIDPKDLETREDMDLKALQAMDPNLIPTDEQVNVGAQIRNRKLRRVSPEELLGGPTIRPNGGNYGPSTNFGAGVTESKDSDR